MNPPSTPADALPGIARPQALVDWHAFAAAQDPRGLHQLVADDAVFHSPVVHTPQRGKAITIAYLAAAMEVLGKNQFRYVREIVGAQDAVLEFECELDGVHVNGVDLIRWNTQGQIVDFKVMLRPAKALDAVKTRMAEMLQRMAGKPAA